VILGGLILCGGVLGSSFVPNFPVFCVLYASFFGIGLGLAYMPPVLSAWSYFPEHKGRISGIIIGGFGLGAAIFNEIATVLVNPDDKEPEIEVKKGDVTDHYYDWSVS
jgi:MFS family permease